MKYQQRKYAKEYRKAGLPFMAAKRLARLREKSATYPSVVEQEMAKEGIEVDVLTFCECCGPEAYVLIFKGKQVHLKYWSLGVE